MYILEAHIQYLVVTPLIQIFIKMQPSALPLQYLKSRKIICESMLYTKTGGIIVLFRDVWLERRTKPSIHWHCEAFQILKLKKIGSFFITAPSECLFSMGGKFISPTPNFQSSQPEIVPRVGTQRKNMKTSRGLQSQVSPSEPLCSQ